MKWAIVDFYLQPKISHEYVKRAYQPLLVSLQHEKRRWNPGETFKGDLWIVNDYFTEYNNLALRIICHDKNGTVVHEETHAIRKVEEDSSVKVEELTFRVPGEKGEKFHMELELLDQDGEKLSANEYFLLVDDQQEATAFMRELGQEARSRNQPGVRTIRYFPVLMGEDYIPTQLIEDFN